MHISGNPQDGTGTRRAYNCRVLFMNTCPGLVFRTLRAVEHASRRVTAGSPVKVTELTFPYQHRRFRRSDRFVRYRRAEFNIFTQSTHYSFTCVRK